ncbi:hypothetical protein BWR17_19680 (plasmid) [Phaeobacter inhibens]|nr:hypothetical protein BWR17_19680 [Phaeobacter inhibens]
MMLLFFRRQTMIAARLNFEERQMFKRTFFLSAVAAAGLLAPATPAQAQGFDMDCKVILCMAGGFPAGCSDAYRYMIDRITRFPRPLPPFGICSQDDGTPYRAVNAPYAYLQRNSPSGWDCPATHRLYFRQNGDRDRSNNITTFCYTHTTTTRGRGRDEPDQVVFHGRIPANHVNFQVQVTVEPGTPDSYTSPLYRLNYSTGYVDPSIGG